MKQNKFPSDLARAFTDDPPDKADILISRARYLDAETDTERQQIRSEYPQYSDYFDSIDELLKDKPKNWKYKPRESKIKF